MKEGNKKIPRITATINLAGLPESGKTTLIDRMLGRPLDKENFSTDVSESMIVVNINPNKPTSEMSTVSVKTQGQSEDYTWKETKCDTSFLSDVCRSKEHTSTDSTDADENSTNKTTPVVLRETLPIPNSEANSSGSSNSSKQDSNLSDQIMDILEKCGIESIEDLKTKGSLYIRDVGGQIEFQESLSLLINGSSIYLFVFNATIAIDTKRTIKYRAKKKEDEANKEVKQEEVSDEVKQEVNDEVKQEEVNDEVNKEVKQEEVNDEVKHDELNEYQSSISTKDALLQCLASIKALQITKKSQEKEDEKDEKDEQDVKAQVFIVGTHMDLLDKCDFTCETINEQLHKIITDSKCASFVQYKDKDNDEVMFAVNNKLEKDDGMKTLCNCINYLFIGECFIVKYPVRYILFALNLPYIKDEVLTLEECENIADKFGIKKDEVPKLLRFLHLRTGILLWFDVKDLRNWVFKEPQFLFNKVTELIKLTFMTSKKVLQHELSEIEKKGILEEIVIHCILSNHMLKPKQFLDFLIHLRMVVRFEDKEAQKYKYFIPCVLNHVSSPSSETETDIPPLNITFGCGYCPKGLFGVLATYFIEHPWKCKDVFTVTFDYGHIYKDEIAFIATFDWLKHTVYLKMYPSHLEVKFRIYKDSSDAQLHTACNAIRTTMLKYINDSVEHLRYNADSVAPIKMNLQCPNDGCYKLHEVVGDTQRVFYCIRTEDKINCKAVGGTEDKINFYKLPSKAKYWFPKGKDCMSKINLCSYNSETLINTYSTNAGYIQVYNKEWWP